MILPMRAFGKESKYHQWERILLMSNVNHEESLNDLSAITQLKSVFPDF